MSTSSWRSVQYGTHCWNVASCAALQSPFGGSQPSFRMFGSCQASYCDCVTCIGVATCCAKFCGKMQSAHPSIENDHHFNERLMIRIQVALCRFARLGSKPKTFRPLRTLAAFKTKRQNHAVAFHVSRFKSNHSSLNVICRIQIQSELSPCMSDAFAKQALL